MLCVCVCVSVCVCVCVCVCVRVCVFNHEIDASAFRTIYPLGLHLLGSGPFDLAYLFHFERCVEIDVSSLLLAMKEEFRRNLIMYGVHV